MIMSPVISFDPRSMNRSSSYASRLLYHQYLPDSSSNASHQSISTTSATCDRPQATSQIAVFPWDMKTTCKSMLPAFSFIAQRLARHGLQITLLVSEHAPFVIPVWELPVKSQSILTKIIRKACSKYRISPSWMAALAALESKKDLPRVFEVYKADAYIVRRSLLQNEVVFSDDGLTLLSVDHIFTLKQLLCTLSKKEWVPYSRETCLVSCAHLLNRIHHIHNGTKFTKGYIDRVYEEIPFQAAIFDEVETVYEATFCTASLRDITSDLDFMAFHDLSNEKPEEQLSPAVELSDTAVQGLVSPLTAVNPNTLFPWNNTPSVSERVSNLTVTYPAIHKLSVTPPTPLVAQVSDQSPESVLGSDESFYSGFPSEPESVQIEVAPSPLKIVKRETFPIEQSPVEDERTLAAQAEGEESQRLSVENVIREEEARKIEEVEKKSRMIIEAWCKGVQEVVCARCYDFIEEPRRYTLCY